LGSYTIETLPTARKELLSLPGAVQKRIGKKIDSLKDNLSPDQVAFLDPPGPFFCRFLRKKATNLSEAGVSLSSSLKLNLRNERMITKGNH